MKILVETSARHLHVTKADLETLFGAGAALSHKKDLSQPGQFATNEKVRPGSCCGRRFQSSPRPLLCPKRPAPWRPPVWYGYGVSPQSPSGGQGRFWQASLPYGKENERSLPEKAPGRSCSMVVNGSNQIYYFRIFNSEIINTFHFGLLKFT